jgi:hypothetical protein
MARSLGECERYSTHRAERILLLEEGSQENGIKLKGEVCFPGAESSRASNVAEMVLDSTAMMSIFLVLGTSLAKARPAFRTQTAVRLYIEVLLVGRVCLAATATRAKTVVSLESHPILLMAGV